MNKTLWLAVLALIAAHASGCGGQQERKTAATGAGASGEGDLYGVSGGEGDGDQSTGGAIPSGPGEDAPPEHVITANAKGAYNEGVTAANAGKLDQAEQAFARTLQIDPRAHQAAYNLGVIADRRGRSDVAKGHYRKAIDLQPNYLPAISALANLEIRTGNLEAAIGLLRTKAGSYPRDIGVLNRYADALIIAKRYSDAIDVAKQALRVDERNADAMLYIGKANLRLGRIELAQAVFDQVLEINPEEAEIYFLRSFINLAEDNRAEAIVNLKTTIEKRPTHVEAMNNLATQYLVSGNYDAAIAQIEQALSLAPSWGVLHLNYGNALRGAKRWKPAKAELKRARELEPTLLGALFNMGILYYVADDIDNLDRLERYNQAKRLFAQYKTEMGSALTKQDEVHKYLKELQIAVEREERRIKQSKDQAEQEAKREAEREAAAAAAAAAGTAEGIPPAAGGGDEEEGWE